MSLSPPLRPSRLRNIVANYAGVFTTLLVQVFLVPVYVRILGAESWGIIGFFITMQAVLQVAELGFGMALNRELARRSATSGDGADTPSLLRTLEVVSWSVGLTLGLGVWALAPTLASHWVTSVTLPADEVLCAIALMGLALALQWPQSIYSGGLLGLQRQARVVAVTAGTNLVFAMGAIVLLWRFPSLTTFFLWRAFVSLLGVLVQRRQLWRSLPASSSGPRFCWAALQPIWKFSLGMSAISATGIALIQIDKLVISRLVSLDRFGAYMLASTAAALIPQMVSPIFTAHLPALSQAFGQRDEPAQQSLFRSTSRLISSLAHPVALAVAFFSEPLLFLWTGNAEMSAQGAPILSLLAVGALLNSIMVPLYAVQLAAGWTRLATFTNLVLVVTMIPYSIIAASRFGAIGAASTWPFLNAVYLALGSALTFPRLPRGLALQWATRDVLAPLLASLAVVGLAWLLLPVPVNRFLFLAFISIITLTAMGACVASSDDLRGRVCRALRHISGPTKT